MLVPQNSARKAWPWPWPWFWTQTMNVRRLTLDYFNCLTLNWWDKTLRWHVGHCYIKCYGTFLKKISDLQNQGHVTSKSNFPSWKHGKMYSTMLPLSNDTKFMLVTCNANDFTSETWLIGCLFSRTLNVRVANLKSIRLPTGSQWSSWRTGWIWSYFLHDGMTTRARPQQYHQWIK